MKKKYLPLFLLLLGSLLQAQVPIELYTQFNGKYNHTALGNTLNLQDNSLAGVFCDVLTQSSADLNLTPDQQIVGAYLYWSAPINPDAIPEEQIDDLVSINGTEVSAEETYTYTLNSIHRYFACFADVTSLVQGIGNGTYTFTDLDLSFLLTSPYFCWNGSPPGNQTNYGGWAISIVYEQDSLPYNQVSIFNGLDGVSSLNNYIPIQLTNLNVIDNDGAKIAFLAWEGDEALSNGESLFINGNQISNAPLNPASNAFNGTNSYTNSDQLHNMDLDFYDIQNNIAPGDTEALIELQSLQDLVMVNYVVTVLNSQLPDATVVIDDLAVFCDNRDVWVEYTIFNVNSTEFLPASTPIAFYADGILVGMASTQNDIPIGGEETYHIQLSIPIAVADDFTLTIVADDDGTGTSTVIETNENNNSTFAPVSLFLNPFITSLSNLEDCDAGNNQAVFDLTSVESQLPVGFVSVEYYTSYDDAIALVNQIVDPFAYTNTSDPQTIYVRVDFPDCFQIVSFELNLINCLPDNFSSTNGISPNGDGLNDYFVLPGVTDVFENHTIKVFNRYGTLIFEGDFDKPWRGKANRGINHSNELLPVSTYYYVVDLHDARYPEPILGWVYLNY